MVEDIKKMVADLNPFDDFDENTDLLEDGILDSIDITELIDKLETKYNIEIPLTDINEKNFNTINNICVFLHEKYKFR